jgi:hypothetical protein
MGRGRSREAARGSDRAGPLGRGGGPRTPAPGTARGPSGKRTTPRNPFPSKMRGGEGRTVADAGRARVEGVTICTAWRGGTASRSRSLCFARRRRRVRQQGASRVFPATRMRWRRALRGCGDAHTACCVRVWCLIARPLGRGWVCVWPGAGGRGGGGGDGWHSLRGGGGFD